MRKYIALVLALVCVLGLVGCSDKNMTFDIGEASKMNIKSGITGGEVNIALSSAPAPAPKKLTLEEVVELSEKGEGLTWSDFEQYAYEDIGFGLYIYRYDIDSNYELRIGGSPSVEPMYILLVSKANQDNYIDIRTGNVQDFIKPTG